MTHRDIKPENPSAVIHWRAGKPTCSGYYLACWTLQSGKRITSELWFNVGDGRGTWWAGRGYLEGFGASRAAPFLMEPIPGVYVWSPVPAPLDPVYLDMPPLKAVTP